MSSGGAGTSESAASAGCSLSEHDRLRPSNNNGSSRSNSNGSNAYQRMGHNHYNGGASASGDETSSDNANNSPEGGLAVFTWGRGEDGQLGLGDTSDQDEPTYVDALRGVGVRQIACGSGHTVVLSTEGEVYTWGRGDDGRLGHGDNGWKYVPRITRSLAGQVVTQVTCGSYHTAAVTGNGDLYTWQVAKLA
jgi:alpha-tubulin suppressor-like RCC1 family protein